MTGSDPRTLASQLIDSVLIETRTWSTDEVRQMMNEAAAAERARLLADMEPLIFTKECGCGGTVTFSYMPLIDELIGEAVAAEHEACEDLVQKFCWPGGMDGMQLYLRDSIAKAIRERGKVSIP
jgi:hypothetical protein